MDYQSRRLLTPAEVAEQLGVPVKTLHVWRGKGVGPRAGLFGKHLRYRQADVDAYIDEQVNKRTAA